MPKGIYQRKKGLKRVMSPDFKPGPRPFKFDLKSMANRRNQHNYYRKKNLTPIKEISDNELEKRMEEKFKKEGWD